MTKVSCELDDEQLKAQGLAQWEILDTMWAYVKRTNGCKEAKRVADNAFELRGEDDLMLIGAIMNMLNDNRELMPYIKAVPVFVNGKYDDDIKEVVLQDADDENY